jgi:hypothetical protein
MHNIYQQYMFLKADIVNIYCAFVGQIQRDSKRWTQFRTSIFPELYMVCE